MLWPLLSLAALVAAWLATVLQHAAPRPLAQALLTATIVAAAATAAARLRRGLAAAGNRRERLWILAAVGVVALSLALRFAGLDHEVGDRYYRDEGTYLRHASEINSGHPIRGSFVYPHLVYYLGAFAIWIASLAPEALLAVCRWLWPGVHDWAILSRFMVRAVVALCGGLAAWPVLALGRRLAGRTAGLLSGLLLALSPVWDEGSHLGICDVPSAFFAAVCLAACGRWLDDSRPAIWIGAGAAAGLAAGAKYPAGLVAVAIVALAARDLLTTPALRRWSLAIAGSAALAAFLAVNPSLIALPRAALQGERGVLFGAIQYSSEGWLGVAPESRVAWYGGRIVDNFGWPALMLGISGLAVASRDALRRLAWLLPFPVVFLSLLVYLPVAVVRNLYPALPALAAVFGVGLGSLVVAATRRGFHRAAIAAVTAAVCAWPAWTSLAQAIAYVRPSTRDSAVLWLRSELPRGFTLMPENYAPNVPRPEFRVVRPPGRFAALLTIEEAAARGVDAVVLASASWGRFFAPGADLGEGDAILRDRYARYRTEGDLLRRFEPGPFRRGPTIEIVALPLAARRLTPPISFSAAQLVVPDDAMRQGAEIVAHADGEFAAAVLPLAAGSWRLAWTGATGAGAELRAATLRGRPASIRRDGGDSAVLELPREDTVVVSLVLTAGDRVQSMTVDAVEVSGRTEL